MPLPGQPGPQVQGHGHLVVKVDVIFCSLPVFRLSTDKAYGYLYSHLFVPCVTCQNSGLVLIWFVHLFMDSSNHFLPSTRCLVRQCRQAHWKPPLSFTKGTTFFLEIYYQLVNIVSCSTWQWHILTISCLLLFLFELQLFSSEFQLHCM